MLFGTVPPSLHPVLLPAYETHGATCCWEPTLVTALLQALMDIPSRCVCGWSALP